MKLGTVIWVVVALAVLLYGTVAVFEAFDRVSHSNSDTIRPFILTMGPVWTLAIADGPPRVRSGRARAPTRIPSPRSGKGRSFIGPYR